MNGALVAGMREAGVLGMATVEVCLIRQIAAGILVDRVGARSCVAGVVHALGFGSAQRGPPCVVTVNRGISARLES